MKGSLGIFFTQNQTPMQRGCCCGPYTLPQNIFWGPKKRKVVTVICCLFSYLGALVDILQPFQGRWRTYTKKTLVYPEELYTITTPCRKAATFIELTLKHLNQKCELAS